ncbi:MAG: hypothetical protein U0Q22_09675 [Acidimicrobiales bacterium]
MTPLDAASAIARPIGSIGSRFMFDPTTYAAAAEHGFDGLDFYFCGRCGVLGDVDPDVVVATLGFFEPATVRSLWNQGRAAQPPHRAAELFADACAQWGRDHFGADVDYDELSGLAGRVIAAAQSAGQPLFAGWRALDVPSDGKGAAALRLNILREYRGGAHLIAVVAAGIDPAHAVLSTGGAPNAALFGYVEPYPDVAHLANAMLAVEQRTGELAAQPLEALDDTEREHFVELVRAVRGGLI